MRSSRSSGIGIPSKGAAAEVTGSAGVVVAGARPSVSAVRTASYNLSQVRRRQGSGHGGKIA